MTDYPNYTEKDFITDEYFRQWVLHPTPEHDSFWESWLERYPEKSHIVAKAKSFILSLEYQVNLPNAGKKAEIFKKVISRSESKISKQRIENVRAIHRVPLYRKVAVWVLLIASVAGLTYMTASNWLPKENKVVETPYVRFTKAGEKLTLKLTDGSVVKLNANSSIEIPNNFHENRQVYLKGEAFFNIVRDTLRPFTVHNKEVDIQVLGTSFNVNGKENDENTTVAVATGLVAVTSTYNNEKIMLKPNEMVLYSQNKQIKRNFDPSKVLAWKDGILYFESASLTEIAEKLEAWYGYEIILQDNPKLKRKFSGKFNDRSLEEVLEGIQYTSDIQFKIDEKKVYITPKK